jgi:hypothetical protein
MRSPLHKVQTKRRTIARQCHSGPASALISLPEPLLLARSARRVPPLVAVGSRQCTVNAGMSQCMFKHLLYNAHAVGCCMSLHPLGGAEHITSFPNSCRLCLHHLRSFSFLNAVHMQAMRSTLKHSKVLFHGTFIESNLQTC